MHARSHRFLSGLVIVALALTANALLDYRLILRNPAELEEIARNALQGIFPDYAPHIGRAPEFYLSERKAVLREVVFHEKGQAGRTLFRVGTLEAYFRLVPPGLVRLNVTEPEGVLRIDRDGNINFETGGEVGGTRPTLYTDLEVQVDGGQLRVINEFEGQKTDALLTDVQAELTVTTDLAVQGRGRAQFGVVVPAGSLGREIPKPLLEHDRRFSPIMQGIDFKVEREVNGRVRGEVDLRGLELAQPLKSIIPPLFQEEIWDELDPSGVVDARLRADTTDRGVRIAATILPRAAIRPRGFPTEITDIVGRFEVNVFKPWAGRPDFIGVSWDQLTSRACGGRLTSRGSVFPGGPAEKVSLFISVLAEDLVLGPAFQDALPPKIRAVYDEFDPQGVVQRGRVVIFKGPHQQDPQLSVRVEELAGRISAAYRDVPLRLQELTGSFEIREDANVEIHAGGTFQHGGTARVDANVIKGDILHVDVRAADLPLTAPVLEALPARARRVVNQFRPRDGQADVHVIVDKQHAGALAQPRIHVQLRDVTIVHEEVPYPLTTTGSLDIVPRFPATRASGAPDPAGALPEDRPDPERIEVGVDLTAWGAGVVAATARGHLSVPPDSGDFEGELLVRASQVSLDDDLRDALPERLLTVWRQLSPRGAVRQAEVTIHGPERMRVQGEAADLSVTLAEFPYPLRVDAFSLTRDGALIRLHEVKGGALEGGGALTAGGTVMVTPAGRPIVDLDLAARDMPLDAALVSALPPGGARDVLSGMRPQGRADAALRVLVPPGDGDVRVQGPVTLRGAQVHLHRIHESLAGLADEPLRNLAGAITLNIPDRIELTALRGTLRQGQVEATGRIVRPPPAPAAAGAIAGAVSGLVAPASARAEPAMDLVVHVGGLVLDERTRAMAGPAAAGVFRQFQPEGPVDLQAHVHRAPLDARTRVRLRARARGLTAVPAFFPLRLRDIEGDIEVDDGEPVYIDLSARLGSGTLTVRRDRRAERAFPGAGARGRVFEVDLRDFARPTDPRDRADLERLLPDPGPIRRLLGVLEPEGPIDVHAFIYQPLGEREALRWVAEVRTGPRNEVGAPARPDFSLQLDSKKLRFEGIRGIVRAAGSVAELALGSCEGELELTQLEYSRQTATNVRGPFKLQDGVLSIGVPGTPVVGDLYGGKIKAIAQYTVKTGEYLGWVEIVGGGLQRAMEQLGELRDPKEKPNLAPRPFRGTLDAYVQYAGGGKTLGGRDIPLDGEGWVLIRETNLAEVPGLDFIRKVRDVFSGTHSRPFAFERMWVKFGLDPDRMLLHKIELDSPSGIGLVCLDGQMLFDPAGQLINVTLSPVDTGSSVLQRFVESAPLVSYKLEGKLWDPGINVIPFYSPIERFVRWLFGLDEEKDAAARKEDEAEGED